jgi:cytochrome c oxidase cbb3-type subunit 4
MYKAVLNSILDVSIFPVISIIIFFTFFVGVIVYVIKQDKAFVERMANLPNENDNEGEHRNV